MTSLSFLRPFAIRNCLKHFSTQNVAFNIGFIGLGNMGGFMSSNLLKHGHNVTVFDINPDSMAKLEKKGARVVSDVKDVPNGNNIIITMLPENSHVTDVIRKISPNLSSGTLLIDSSTIDPNISQMLNNEISSIGSIMIDAPVSGGVTGAENGTLTFMVGGSETAFNMAKPVLMGMGKNFVHCGPPGSGEIAKLCNNLSLAISMIGTSEAMNLGEKLGMDPSTLAGIMNTSTSRCWSSDTYNPYPGVIEGVPSSKNYEGGFSTDLILKDLHLAQQAGKPVHVNLPMTSLASQLYSILSCHGAGKKDFSFILQFLRGTKI